MLSRMFRPCAGFAGACLLPLAILTLAGCGAESTVTRTDSTTGAPTAATVASGNWAVSAAPSTTPPALPGLSGELSSTSAASIQGILHANAASSCVSPKTSFAVTGAADSHGAVTLTGPIAGGTLTVLGTLSSDGRSLQNASYSVAGGSCAMSTAQANAQQYASISGTYSGLFFDADSATVPVLQMTAQLSQSPASDTDGNFTLTGQMTTGQNPCFSVPTALTSAQVTGGTFTMTYTDNTLGNTVTASGTFSTDGTTLQITNWSLSGSCGADTGTGSLKKQ